MDILLALIPALAWGSIVLFNVKLGGEDLTVKRWERRLGH